MRRLFLSLALVVGLLVGPALMSRHQSSWSVRDPLFHRIGQFYLPTVYAALPQTETCPVGFPSASWTAGRGTMDDDAAGKCKGTGAGSPNGVWWNADSFNDYQYSQVIVSSTNLYPGVWCRASGSGGTNVGYVFYGDGVNAVRLYEVAAGADTALGPQEADNWTTGDELKIVCNGTSIKGYINDVEVIAATDATITSGSAGINNYGDSALVDDWEGGNDDGTGGGGGRDCRLALLGVGC